MSLDWNITKVKDSDALHESDAEWTKTQSIIWATMFVDISTIKESNWFDFHARLIMVDRIRDLGWSDITAGDIYRRIGLSTNANNSTESQFSKRWMTKGLILLRHEAMESIKHQESVSS